MMQCLARARLELAGTRNIHPIANRCAEGILFFLRLAGKEVPFALGKSANRFMLELLSDEKARQQYLALLGRLIESRCQFSRDEWKFHIRPAVEAIRESVQADGGGNEKRDAELYGFGNK